MNTKTIMLNLQNYSNYIHDSALVAYWTNENFHIKQALGDVVDMLHGLGETPTEGSALHELCLKYDIDPHKQVKG